MRLLLEKARISPPSSIDLAKQLTQMLHGLSSGHTIRQIGETNVTVALDVDVAYG